LIALLALPRHSSPQRTRLECQNVPNVHFTDITVRSLKPGLYFDDVTPAFGLRVGKHRRTWIVVKGDRAHRSKIKLGHYPDLSLSVARQKAYTALGSPHAPRRAVTFAEAVTEFLEHNYKHCKGRRTKSEAKRLLERLAITKGLAELSDPDCTAVLHKLSHVPSEQLHAFRVLRTMLRWCTKPPHRYIPHSPLEGYAAPGKDHKRSRILSDLELVKIWNSCDGKFGGMIRLIILWGTRSGETARLRRSWIEGGVMTIDGSCTKNGRAHAIPILPMALEVLADQRTNYDYFFPGRWEEVDTHFNDGSWGKEKQKLDERAGVYKWQVRDLRRTFRSNMARLGVSRELCEILINHVTGTRNDLDEVYDRYDYLDQKRHALQRYETHLASLLHPREIQAA
jgi:integrase